MQKFLLKSFSITAVSLFTLFNFSPLINTVAAEVTTPDSNPVSVSQEPQEQEELLQLGDREGTITEEAASTSEEEEPVEKIESSEENQIGGSYVKNGAITYRNITSGVDYPALENNGAKIRFTSLPNLDLPIALTIKKVTVSGSLLTEDPVSEAYEFTTTPELSKGSFQANITLPLKERAEDGKVSVQYSEDGFSYDTQADDLQASSNTVSFATDHFTIFWVTDDEAVLTGGTWTEQTPRGSGLDATDGIHYPSFDTADETATWNFTSITPGEYYVYVSWTTNVNRAQNAKYTLTHTGGTNNFFVNQEQLADQATAGTPGQFSGFCNFGSFTLNTSSKVELFTNENSSNTEYVIADEVLLVPVVASTVDSKVTADTTPSITGHISVDDDNNPTSVNVSVNGANYAVNTDGSGNWTLADNTIPAPLADGTYEVTATYTNLGGTLITDVTSSELTIDTAAPDVNIQSPTDGDFVSGIVPIIATVIDDNPDHYWLRIQGPGYTGGPGTVYEYNSIDPAQNLFNWNTVGLPDGTYTIKLEARDAANNKDAGSIHWIQVKIDNTAPAKPTWGTIYRTHTPSPANEIGCGGYTNTTQVSFEWNLNPESDIAGYWFGTKFNDHHQYFAHPSNFKTASMTPGNNPYYYTIIAVDMAGNESEISDPCGLILDQSAPSTVMTSPADNTYWNQPIPVVGTTTDNYITKETNLYYKAAGSSDPWTLITTLVNADNDAVFDWSYDWTPSAEGAYDIKAAGTDAAGNVETSAYAYNVVYDVTNPFLSITNPSYFEIINESDVPFNVEGYAFDGTSGIQDIRVNFWRQFSPVLEGSFWATYNDVTNQWSLQINQGDVPDGIYRIIVRARDNAGNTTYRMIQFVYIDTTRPTVSITEPVSNSKHTGNMDVYGEAEDNFQIIKDLRVTFRKESDNSIAARYWFDPANGKFEVAYNPFTNYWEIVGGVDTTTLDDGLYLIRIRARDFAGNFKFYAVRNILIDNTKPESEIHTPASSTITGTNPVTFTYSENDNGTIGSGVTSVDIYVNYNGGSYSLDRTLTESYVPGPADYTFDYTFGDDGMYCFYSIATDMVGLVEDAPKDPDTCIQYQSASPEIVLGNYSQDEGSLGTFTAFSAQSDQINRGIYKVRWSIRKADQITYNEVSSDTGVEGLIMDTSLFPSVFQNYNIASANNNYFVDDPVNPFWKVELVRAYDDVVVDTDTGQVIVNNVMPQVTLSATAGANSVSSTTGGATPTLNVSAGQQVTFSGSFVDPAGDFDAGPGWQGRMNYGFGFFTTTVNKVDDTNYNVVISPRTYVNGTYNAFLRVCEEGNLYGFCSVAPITLVVTGGTSPTTDTGGNPLPGSVGNPVDGETGEVLGIGDAFGLGIAEEFNVSPGESAIFGISAAGDLGFEGLECTWDFGDGNTETANAEETNGTQEHTYDDEGTYELSVTCTDEEGNTDTVTSSVKVGEDAAEEAAGEVAGDSDSDDDGDSNSEKNDSKSLGDTIKDNALLCGALPVLLLAGFAIVLLLNRRRGGSRLR